MVTETESAVQHTTGLRVSGTWLHGPDGKCIGTAYGGEHWVIGYEDEDKKRPIFGLDPEGRPAEANARLWAAAPDLLAALKDALVCTSVEEGRHDACGFCEYVDGDHRPDCWVPRAQVAYLKATGS